MITYSQTYKFIRESLAVISMSKCNLGLIRSVILRHFKTQICFQILIFYLKTIYFATNIFALD